MVFQNPDNQIVSSVVEEDVAFALENLGVPYEEMRRRVDESLKAVGMYDYRLHSPSQLSGGQKQRVAIAGVIAMQPKVLILDDSTSAVDTATDAAIRRTFAERIPGVTKIIISQRILSIMDADRIIVMDNGRVNAFDTHENLLRDNEIYRDIYEMQTSGAEGDFDEKEAMK